MKQRVSIRQRNSGFSLAEMLLVIGILMILSGLATYSFMGASQAMRVKATVQTVDSYLKGARQVAINTRSERRFVIEMYRNTSVDPNLKAGDILIRMWVEKRKAEFLDWGTLCYEDDPSRLELVSDVELLPEFMRLSDVSGVDAATLLRYTRQKDRLLLFFQFSNTGSLRAYMNTATPRDDLGSIIADSGRRFTGSGTRSIYPHFCRKDTYLNGTVRDRAQKKDIEYYYAGEPGGVLYLDESRNPPVLNLSAIVAAGAKPLSLITGNPAAGMVGELGRDRDRLMVERTIRRQVGTLQVIPLTGRSRAYDYGVGYPFSIDEIVEGIL